MCGICGFWTDSQQGIDSQLHLQAMADMSQRLSHRGPDDHGSYNDNKQQVGLAHRRLSIVDLSAAGKQPMNDPAGDVWVSFNGEIYNHLELRQRIADYPYRTQSDTEVILAAYQKYGLDFLSQLDGMFAISLWDNKKKQLILARDRIGIKPLYFYFKQGLLLFASEQRALLMHPDITVDLDYTAVDHYLTCMASGPDHSLIKGIRKLAPGHMLIMQDNAPPNIKAYWSMHDYIDDYRPADLQQLFCNAVKKRMMADVPVGIFLSGGLDSSLNAALISEYVSEPINSFSVYYEDDPNDTDRSYAQIAADHFHTRHHEIQLSHRDLSASLAQIIECQDEPLADWVCFPIYFLAKAARDHGVKVVHVGEGSDEQFFGYQSFWKQYQLTKWQQTFTKYAGPLSKLLLGASRLMHQAGPLSTHRHGIIQRFLSQQSIFSGGAIAWQPLSKQQLYGADHAAPLPFEDLKQDFFQKHPHADLSQWMLFLELHQRLPELLLMRVDKMCMAWGVEARVPFLDYKLVEWTLSLPDNVRLQHKQPKYLLKQAFQKYLPETLLNRPKKGFDVPMSAWMKGPLHQEIESGIFDSKLKDQRLFDYEFLHRLWKDNKTTQADHSVALWTIYNLSKWYHGITSNI